MGRRDSRRWITSPLRLYVDYWVDKQVYRSENYNWYERVWWGLQTSLSQKAGLILWVLLLMWGNLTKGTSSLQSYLQATLNHIYKGMVSNTSTQWKPILSVIASLLFYRIIYAGLLKTGHHLLYTMSYIRIKKNL